MSDDPIEIDMTPKNEAEAKEQERWRKSVEQQTDSLPLALWRWLASLFRR